MKLEIIKITLKLIKYICFFDFIQFIYYIFQELLKVLYVDPELTYIKDMELSPTSNSEKSTSYDGRNGVRYIKNKNLGFRFCADFLL